MQHTTGLCKDDFTYLVAALRRDHPELATRSRARGGNTALGFFRRVHLTVMSLRTNVTQHVLAEVFSTSQSTVSRVIAAFTDALARLLAAVVPTGDDVPAGEQLLIDGTLLPCWSWRDRPDLYSGKHRATGVNIQVAARHDATLVWVSDPLPGRTHDANAIRQSHILETVPEGASWSHIGDLGYLGLGMLTPKRTPPRRTLTDTEKKNNKAINSTRSAVEHAIAHLKTWRVLHTDYRRPFHTFETTITAVIGLQFYRTTDQAL